MRAGLAWRLRQETGGLTIAPIRRALLGVMALALAAHVGLHVHAATFQQARPSLIGASLVFTLFGLAHAGYMLGWPRALRFFALCVVLSGLLEQIAIWTGDVGDYYYTDVLGPKLGDVPIIIPISWFMMIYPSYVIANLIVDGSPVAAPARLVRLLWLALITAGVETAWDLSLDPYMTGQEHAWVWPDGGAYFGIPIANYFGWMQVTLIVIVIYRLWERRLPWQPLGPVSRRVASLPLIIYGLNGASDVVSGYPDATRLLPLFVMGIPLLIAGNRLAQWRGAPAKEPGS